MCWIVSLSSVQRRASAQWACWAGACSEAAAPPGPPPLACAPVDPAGGDAQRLLLDPVQGRDIKVGTLLLASVFSANLK